MIPRTPKRSSIGLKHMTPEQKRAYSRERYLSAKERRKAMGLNADGQVPHPLPPKSYDEKQCAVCQRWLPAASFYVGKNRALSGKCRICSRAYMKGWKLNAKEAAWFEKQLEGASCWVCEATDNLCIDHDHKTGRARGILCTRCNGLLGHLKESSARFQRIADYLKHHGL